VTGGLENGSYTGKKKSQHQVGGGDAVKGEGEHAYGGFGGVINL